jgi:hypothetical protein
MKLKKAAMQFMAVMGLIVMLLSVNMSLVYAEDEKKAPAQNIFYLADPAFYGDIPAPDKNQDAQTQFASLVWGLVQNVRYIIGAVAIAMIVFSGFRMVTGWGKEDVYQQQRANIFFAIIGLTAVGMAGELANVFAVTCPPAVAGQPTAPCVVGGFLKDPNAIVRTATLFDQRTQIIITFIKYFVGAIAVLMIVTNGLRMVTMGSSEDKIELDKKNLFYSVIGLVLIIMADTVINKVLYKIDRTRYPGVGGVEPAIDATRGLNEIIGFTNFIVSIVGPLAVAILLAGGIMYMTSAGNDERQGKAKRLITAALIGLIIIYGAFAIVNTFIVGAFPNPAPATPT